MRRARLMEIAPAMSLQDLKTMAGWRTVKPAADSLQKLQFLEITSENEIKEYMKEHLDQVEEGLTLVPRGREYRTSSGLIDFFAIDKVGTHTVIEVKMKANRNTLTQTRTYMRDLGNDKNFTNLRGMIVAQEFTKRFKDAVEEMRERGRLDLRAFKCKKQFLFEKYV